MLVKLCICFPWFTQYSQMFEDANGLHLHLLLSHLPAALQPQMN